MFEIHRKEVHIFKPASADPLDPRIGHIEVPTHP